MGTSITPPSRASARCCLAASAAAALALTACAPASASDMLVFASFGGAFQDDQAEAWQAPFTEQTGVEFENTSPADMAQIRAMVDAGQTTWDLADVSAHYPVQYCGEYFEEIDRSLIDESQFSEGAVSDCAVPAERFARLMVYNADTYGDDPPTSLADFLDTERFPGQRAMERRAAGGILETILIADGVDPEQLYPLDVDRGLEALDGIRDVTTFAENNGALQQLVTDGQADMALIVSARAITVARDDVPIEPVWGDTVITYNSLAIPKGAPNAEAAREFLAFATQPEQSAAFAERSGTAPVNLEAEPEYDDIAEKFNAFTPDRTRVWDQDSEWWAEHSDETEARFTSWLVG